MIERDAVVAGRYRLGDRIGTGGMGSVWRAHDERLGRTVALKLLHGRPGLSEADAQVAKDRALREARNTARLHHAHAVPVFDVVEHEGLPCLVMQYLPSRTLEQVLATATRLPADEVALIGAEVASALAAAHDAGIAHRDVKPGNVLITDDGTAYITDFGISRALGDTTLTSGGMVSGTPAYLAPEVARGADSSFPADVFSLGATLYAALEGQPPFGRDPNAMALLHRVASGAITPPTRSAGLTPLLRRMLAARPEERPTMAEVARTLEHLDVDAPAAAPPAAAPPAAATAVLPALMPPAAPTPQSDERTATLVDLDKDAFGSSSGHAAYDRPEEHRPGARGRALLVALVLVLGAATVFAIQTLRADQAPPAGPERPGSPAASSTAPTMRASTTTSAAPTTTKATTRASTRVSTNATTRPGGPTAQTLAQAISGYYALLPRDTEQGYRLLTDRFRRDKAGSFQSYDAFWGTVRAVDVVDVVGRPPSGAEATMRYTMTDGRVIVERTAYQLVDDGGVLKIDATRLVQRLQ